MIVQNKPYSLAEYVDADCQTLVRNGSLDAIGLGIYSMTEGKPCNGCYANKGCASLAKLRIIDSNKTTDVQPKTETVREEAARRGLSIGEVRRQRRPA